MKKLKFILSIFLLTSFLVACKNPAGNVPENKSGNSTDSENASSEPAAPVDSEQGEESSVVGSNPFPGSLIATDKGIKLTINVPENMLKVEVSRLSGNEKESDAATFNFERKTQQATYLSETLIYDDDFVDSGIAYKYRVRFVTPENKYLKYSVWAPVTATSGSGELKMTNKEKVGGSFNRETLVYSISEEPVYSKPEVTKYAVMISYEDDYSNWEEFWIWNGDNKTEFNFLDCDNKIPSSLPVRAVILKAKYFKERLPENENFKLSFYDNTTVFEEFFRWDNSKGEIWSAVPTDNGVELKIHIPYGIGRVQVYRKTPNAADYSFYANVENWNNEKQKMELLPHQYAVFEDPYVEPNKEYSYKVRFVTPDWIYSSLTEAVTATPNAGKGELKLLNEPTGVLFKSKKVYMFIEPPKFSDVGTYIYPQIVVQSKTSGYGSDTSVYISKNDASFDCWMLSPENNGGRDHLNIQLGINALIYGYSMVGRSRINCTYNASDWYYELENGYFEWNKDNYYPVVIDDEINTDFSVNDGLYNFSFSGTGQYNGLFTGEDETGNSVGFCFLKKTGFPYIEIDFSSASPANYKTSSEDFPCVAMFEKQNDDTWIFMGYKFSEELEAVLSYNAELEEWNRVGTVLKRSESTSLSALLRSLEKK